MPESVGRRRALLLGVGQYDARDDLPPLHTPAADIRALGKVLLDKERCRFDEVKEVCDAEAHRLVESVDALFASAGRDDLVLIYFSGHGKLSPKGGLHLCARNTKLERLLSTTLPLTILNQFINSKPVAQVIVILDCCFSGAAELGFKGGDLPSFVTNDLGQGQGKYVIASSSAIQVSRARPGDRYSLFTSWLIDGLETGNPDTDENGAITIEELFRYARDRTVADEPAQEPQSFTYEIRPGNVIIGYSSHARRRASGSTLASTNPVFFNAVAPLVAEGRIVPFLGAGIFGSGPLSAFRLATALSERAGLAGQSDVATAAEYLEQLLEDRQDFLDAFRFHLSRQSEEVRRNAANELILSVRRPPLVISATYDMLLEKRLEAEGIPHWIVAHVLYSRDGVHDGKILVVRRGNETSAEICRADAFIMPTGDELVIYKVLGSPFLADFADPGDDLDTVVVTESDHLTFVGRLENEHTRVPDAFSVPFKRSGLLFLGYSLDLWHYRLVVRVFAHGRNRPRRTNAVLPQVRAKKIFAIRQPTSQLEELYWQRLPCDMIKVDPDQFAEQLMTVLSPVGVV